MLVVGGQPTGLNMVDYLYYPPTPPTPPRERTMARTKQISAKQMRAEGSLAPGDRVEVSRRPVIRTQEQSRLVGNGLGPDKQWVAYPPAVALEVIKMRMRKEDDLPSTKEAEVSDYRAKDEFEVEFKWGGLSPLPSRYNINLTTMKQEEIKLFTAYGKWLKDGPRRTLKVRPIRVFIDGIQQDDMSLYKGNTSGDVDKEVIYDVIWQEVQDAFKRRRRRRRRRGQPPEPLNLDKLHAKQVKQAEAEIKSRQQLIKRRKTKAELKAAPRPGGVKRPAVEPLPVDLIALNAAKRRRTGGGGGGGAGSGAAGTEQGSRFSSVYIFRHSKMHIDI
jgi:hypothetical protein